MDYISLNKALWNTRTAIHINSDFYNHQQFIANYHNGFTSLKEIELPLLGDLTGLKVLHLQCHFGQDTLSLAKLGAEVTGLDFSNEAIMEARRLAEALGVQAQFVEADVCNIPTELHGKFDVVFTSYGTIGWLPDIKAWANSIDQVLKPNGKLIFVEFHPVVWMFDNNLEKVAYTYHCSDPIVEQEEATYADTSAQINLTSVGWNHGMAEVIGALLPYFKLTDFQEYNYSPYPIFAEIEELEPNRFYPKAHGNKLPLVYSLVMER
ncbi:MAG: class I SAM-dependent methyltransferase [Flexibacteraceae bacterium]